VDVRIDRIQMVVASAQETAAGWERLLEARMLREDEPALLRARRLVLGVGESEVELLEPCGDGEPAAFLARTGGGLFAAGIAVPDPTDLGRRLAAHAVTPVTLGPQLLLSPETLGIPGLRLVVSPRADRPRVGRARFLYEATLLCADPSPATARFADLFGLDPGNFVPIRSPEFGYEGMLTLFDRDRLDRIEIIHPFDAAKTMGRFFARRGPCLYMAYAEVDETGTVRDAAIADAPADWTGPRDTPLPDNLFLHPRALGGMMLGISRTTFAWTWSGRPERVRPAPR